MPVAEIFDPDTFKLLRSQLDGMNGEGLASRIARLPLERGHLRLFVPMSLLGMDSCWSHHEQTESNKGFRVCRVIRDEADHWFTKLIQNYLAGPGNRFAIFEHSAAKAADAFLSSSRYPYFVANDHVYYFFGAKSDSADIIKARNLSGAVKFIGILTSPRRRDPSLTDRGHLDSETLDALVKATDYVLIGVCDGDTELVWSKNGRSRKRPRQNT